VREVFITGSTGFVGKHIQSYFSNQFLFTKYKRETKIYINQDIVLHLAGKAHDLKNTSNSNEYYQVNTELTQKVFDAFVDSNAKVFIILSSVKAVADVVNGELWKE